jgi:hypothetical protein
METLKLEKLMGRNCFEASVKASASVWANLPFAQESLIANVKIGNNDAEQDLSCFSKNNVGHPSPDLNGRRPLNIVRVNEPVGELSANNPLDHPIVRNRVIHPVGQNFRKYFHLKIYNKFLQCKNSKQSWLPTSNL